VSTNLPDANSAKPNVASFTLRELTEMLVRHKGLNEGSYDLSIEFMIGTGQFSPTPDKMQALPGVAVSISKIGLVETKNPGSYTVDAAACNPAKKRTPKNKS